MTRHAPALSFLLGCLALIAPAMTAFAAGPAVGERATGFNGLDAANATVVFDPAARDKPALLLFWATWCPYCKALMPHLQSLQTEVGTGHLDVFAIDIKEDEDADPVAALEKLGPDFILVRDGDAIAEDYGVRGTPVLYLVGADGVILYQRPNGATPEAVKAAVRELLRAQMKDAG